MGNTDGGWVLPDVIDPPRKCFQIDIPDDFHHRAAFFGAIYELTRWYNWQRDDAHTAKDVAAVWKDIWRVANDKFYSQQGSCEMQTLLRMDSLCGILQVSYDGGAVWNNLVDVNQCATNAANAAIDTALANNQIGSPGQQSAGGTVPVNECHTYRVALRGNSRWHCPVPVSAGYTVEVSNAGGATGDNASILALWACPDGKAYALGACGAYRATQPTDPLQSAAHLRLIGYCQGIYMDMYNTSYIVPDGTPESSFFLQVNDGDISDNQGELQLTVAVCNYSQWCYKFLNGAGLGIATVAWGSYDAANDRIVGAPYDAGYAGEIQLVMPAGGYTVEKIEFNYTRGPNPSGNNAEIRKLNPYVVYASHVDENDTYTLVANNPAIVAGNTLNCGVSVGPAGQTGPTTVNWVKIYGTGINPFGGNNC